MLIEHLRRPRRGRGGATSCPSATSTASTSRPAAKFDADEEFQERARPRVVALQGGDPETLRLWRVLVDESTRYFNAVYDRLGVLLEPTRTCMGESAYNDLLPEVVRRLDDAGLLHDSDGADVVFPPGFTNRDGEPLPLIVRKADGGFNYATTDLATVIDRVERLGATLLLYVVGAPQAQHLQMVWAVAEEAGWLQPAGPGGARRRSATCSGADHKMLKSRSGDSVKLVDLLDEAVERAERGRRREEPGPGPRASGRRSPAPSASAR